jgi:hypothetical protein
VTREAGQRLFERGVVVRNQRYVVGLCVRVMVSFDFFFLMVEGRGA